MMKSIGLVLAYFACQVLGVLAAILGGVFYLLATKQAIEMESLMGMILAPALFLGMVFMVISLSLTDNLNKDKLAWSPVSGSYLLLAAVACITLIPLLDFLLSKLSWLPNILEGTFTNLQSDWFGILCIAIFGPVLEELLFRGAITKELLNRHNPVKAIIISALIFGIFHVNPVQVVSATLIGLLLGWIYYKTASLVPCILIHILNNSLSVFLGLKYPDVEYAAELFGNEAIYFLVLLLALVIFAGVFMLMRKTTVPYNWKETPTAN